MQPHAVWFGEKLTPLVTGFFIHFATLIGTPRVRTDSASPGGPGADAVYQIWWNCGMIEKSVKPYGGYHAEDPDKAEAEVNSNKD